MHEQISFKTPQDSMAKQVHIIMPQDVNASYSLFGGILMQWIDVVAGVVSRRHSGCSTRTAAVEKLEFLAPAYVNDIMELEGRIVFVGRTSMVVCVDTYVERPSEPDKPIHINRALLTMVAVDDKGQPTPVPALRIQTIDEQKLWNEAKERRDVHKSLAKKSFSS